MFYKLCRKGKRCSKYMRKNDVSHSGQTMKVKLLFSGSTNIRYVAQIALTIKLQIKISDRRSSIE